MLARLAALLLIGLGGPALAQDAAVRCEGPIDFAQFDRALETTAQAIAFPEGRGAHPLERDIDLVTVPRDGGEEIIGRALLYRVWVAERHRTAPGVDAPRELAIRQVLYDPSLAKTTVRAGLEAGEPVTVLGDWWQAPSWRHFVRIFFIDVSILLVACEPDGESVAYTASGRRIVTTSLAGVMALAVAAAVFVLGLRQYERFVAERRAAQAPAGAAAAQRPGLADRFRGIFLDFRGEVSLSYFQVFLFLFAVYFAFAYVLGRTFQLSNLSETILMLLGISAASGVLGKAVDMRKKRLDWANWAWLNFDLRAFDSDTPVRPHWGQLVSSGGSFDVYRFQALIFTVLVALAILFLAAYNLEEFQLPQGVLALLGISQVTYVVGKFAAPPTIEDFNTRSTEMRARWQDGPTVWPDEATKFAQEFEAALGMPAGPRMVELLQRGAPGAG